MKPSQNERFRVPEQVHARRFHDELVVLNLQAGKYFALNEVGAVIWEHLTAGGMTIDETTERLLSHYDADKDAIRNDVLRITDELLTAGLLERRP